MKLWLKDLTPADGPIDATKVDNRAANTSTQNTGSNTIGGVGGGGNGNVSPDPDAAQRQIKVFLMTCMRPVNLEK